MSHYYDNPEDGVDEMIEEENEYQMQQNYKQCEYQQAMLEEQLAEVQHQQKLLEEQKILQEFEQQQLIKEKKTVTGVANGVHSTNNGNNVSNPSLIPSPTDSRMTYNTTSSSSAVTSHSTDTIDHYSVVDPKLLISESLNGTLLELFSEATAVLFDKALSWEVSLKIIRKITGDPTVLERYEKVKKWERYQKQQNGGNIEAENNEEPLLGSKESEWMLNLVLCRTIACAITRGMSKVLLKELLFHELDFERASKLVVDEDFSMNMLAKKILNTIVKIDGTENEGNGDSSDDDVINTLEEEFADFDPSILDLSTENPLGMAWNLSHNHPSGNYFLNNPNYETHFSFWITALIKHALKSTFNGWTSARKCRANLWSAGKPKPDDKVLSLYSSITDLFLCLEPGCVVLEEVNTICTQLYSNALMGLQTQFAHESRMCQEMNSKDSMSLSSKDSAKDSLNNSKKSNPAGAAKFFEIKAEFNKRQQQLEDRMRGLSSSIFEIIERNDYGLMNISPEATCTLGEMAAIIDSNCNDTEFQYPENEKKAIASGLLPKEVLIRLGSAILRKARCYQDLREKRGYCMHTWTSSDSARWGSDVDLNQNVVRLFLGLNQAEHHNQLREYFEHKRSMERLQQNGSFNPDEDSRDNCTFGLHLVKSCEIAVEMMKERESGKASDAGSELENGDSNVYDDFVSALFEPFGLPIESLNRGDAIKLFDEVYAQNNGTGKVINCCRNEDAWEALYGAEEGNQEQGEGNQNSSVSLSQNARDAFANNQQEEDSEEQSVEGTPESSPLDKGSDMKEYLENQREGREGDEGVSPVTDGTPVAESEAEISPDKQEEQSDNQEEYQEEENQNQEEYQEEGREEQECSPDIPRMESLENEIAHLENQMKDIMDSNRDILQHDGSDFPQESEDAYTAPENFSPNGGYDSCEQGSITNLTATVPPTIICHDSYDERIRNDSQLENQDENMGITNITINDDKISEVLGQSNAERKARLEKIAITKEYMKWSDSQAAGGYGSGNSPIRGSGSRSPNRRSPNRKSPIRPNNNFPNVVNRGSASELPKEDFTPAAQEFQGVENQQFQGIENIISQNGGLPVQIDQQIHSTNLDSINANASLGGLGHKISPIESPNDSCLGGTSQDVLSKVSRMVAQTKQLMRRGSSQLELEVSVAESEIPQSSARDPRLDSVKGDSSIRMDTRGDSSIRMDSMLEPMETINSVTSQVENNVENNASLAVGEEVVPPVNGDKQEAQEKPDSDEQTMQTQQNLQEQNQQAQCQEGPPQNQELSKVKKEAAQKTRIIREKDIIIEVLLKELREQGIDIDSASIVAVIPDLLKAEEEKQQREQEQQLEEQQRLQEQGEEFEQQHLQRSHGAGTGEITSCVFNDNEDQNADEMRDQDGNAVPRSIPPVESPPPEEIQLPYDEIQLPVSSNSPSYDEVVSAQQDILAEINDLAREGQEEGENGDMRGGRENMMDKLLVSSPDLDRDEDDVIDNFIINHQQQAAAQKQNQQQPKQFQRKSEATKQSQIPKPFAKKGSGTGGGVYNKTPQTKKSAAAALAVNQQVKEITQRESSFREGLGGNNRKPRIPVPPIKNIPASNNVSYQKVRLDGNGRRVPCHATATGNGASPGGTISNTNSYMETGRDGYLNLIKKDGADAVGRKDSARRHSVNSQNSQGGGLTRKPSGPKLQSTNSRASPRHNVNAAAAAASREVHPVHDQVIDQQQPSHPGQRAGATKESPGAVNEVTGMGNSLPSKEQMAQSRDGVLDGEVGSVREPEGSVLEDLSANESSVRECGNSGNSGREEINLISNSAQEKEISLKEESFREGSLREKSMREEKSQREEALAAVRSFSTASGPPATNTATHQGSKQSRTSSDLPPSGTNPNAKAYINPLLQAANAAQQSQQTQQSTGPGPARIRTSSLGWRPQQNGKSRAISPPQSPPPEFKKLNIPQRKVNVVVPSSFCGVPTRNGSELQFLSPRGIQRHPIRTNPMMPLNAKWAGQRNSNSQNSQSSLLSRGRSGGINSNCRSPVEGASVVNSKDTSGSGVLSSGSGMQTATSKDQTVTVSSSSNPSKESNEPGPSQEEIIRVNAPPAGTNEHVHLMNTEMYPDDGTSSVGAGTTPGMPDVITYSKTVAAADNNVDAEAVATVAPVAGAIPTSAPKKTFGGSNAGNTSSTQRGVQLGSIKAQGLSNFQFSPPRNSTLSEKFLSPRGKLISNSGVPPLPPPNINFPDAKIETKFSIAGQPFGAPRVIATGSPILAVKTSIPGRVSSGLSLLNSARGTTTGSNIPNSNLPTSNIPVKRTSSAGAAGNGENTNGVREFVTPVRKLNSGNEDSPELEDGDQNEPEVFYDEAGNEISMEELNNLLMDAAVKITEDGREGDRERGLVVNDQFEDVPDEISPDKIRNFRGNTNDGLENAVDSAVGAALLKLDWNQIDQEASREVTQEVIQKQVTGTTKQPFKPSYPHISGIGGGFKLGPLIGGSSNPQLLSPTTGTNPLTQNNSTTSGVSYSTRNPRSVAQGWKPKHSIT